MSMSYRTIRFCLAIGTVAVLSGSAAFAQQTDDAPVDVVISDNEGDMFAVPAGSSAELISFIERLANPQTQFADNAELEQYLDNVSVAISGAADKILADKNATDQQLIDAIEWKLESLRIRGKLGDASADKATDEFLADVDFPDRRAVSNALEQIRATREQAKLQLELVSKLRQWQRLNDSQRDEVVDWLVNAIKTGEPSVLKAQMLSEFTDYLSDSPYTALAVRALNESLPTLRASDDAGVQERIPMLEGLARRLNLPGNEMELEGTFLDGQKLDWDSYRGKVVLVDFWATWCGPCRAEVPNILANFEKYHDKGFEVIGISLDERRGDAESYVAQTKIPWPSLFHEGSQEGGWANPMAVKYGITGIPTAILIDQQGKVVSMQARGRRLGAELEKLLGQPSSDETSAVEVSDRAERTVQATTP
jgi:thiol-disulfide isomerase/thioredoxin